jgi:hypothetical protein
MDLCASGNPDYGMEVFLVFLGKFLVAYYFLIKEEN